MPLHNEPSLTINKGTCYAIFAYDIGSSINLEQADRHISAETERSRLRHKARAPQYFDYRPAPLRLMQEGGSLTVGSYASSPAVEVMVYDFGAVTITYRFALDGPFVGLLELSESLYEHELLLSESRARVEHLVQAIHPAIERPKIATEVEDYLIFSIESCAPIQGAALWASREEALASILRGERTPLADQEIRDALSCRISFGQEDAALIDWHAAVLFGKEMDDVRAVLDGDPARLWTESIEHQCGDDRSGVDPRERAVSIVQEQRVVIVRAVRNEEIQPSVQVVVSP